MSKIKLMNGDCLEKMKLIPSGSVDLILTDPPYGTTSCKWDNVIDFGLMWEQLNRIIKPNGAIVLFGSEPFSSALRMSNMKNFRYDWIWQKHRATGFQNSKHQPLKAHEIISVFYNKKSNYYAQGLVRLNKPITRKSNRSEKTILGKTGLNGKMFTKEFTNYPKSVLNFKNETNSFHPTQKPIPLLEYLIKTYTLENETVLDFTMGSGSTGVAAKNTNRNFIGIELDQDYFEIAKKRIKDA